MIKKNYEFFKFKVDMPPLELSPCAQGENLEIDFVYVPWTPMWLLPRANCSTVLTPPI